MSYPIEESSVPGSALPAVVFTVGAAVKRGAGFVDFHHAALSIAEVWG